MSAIVITGTDTDVGKTVVAAGLASCIPGALYWKPIQAGVDDGTDSERVGAYSGLAPERILPEKYRLEMPASPHLAARLEGVTIRQNELHIPPAAGPLIIEGAGGVLVPLTEKLTMADLFAQWRQPVILVARTSLGTINHSLLSIEALRARSVPVGGIIFSGDAHEENERIIPLMSGVPSLGRMPRLERLDPVTLRQAVTANIDLVAIASLFA